MAIEKRIPSSEDYPNDPLGYAQALIQADLDYHAACFRAIDRTADTSGIRNERAQTKQTQAQYERTINDYLSEHPTLLKRYKQIGPMALLELE